MRRTLGFYAVLVLGTLVSIVFAGQVTNPDRDFFIRAGQSGMAEIALGQMALQKSQNEEVKKFAQMMVDDHTRTNQELLTLAQSKNLTIPADVSSRQRATADRLGRLSGEEFDRAYMKQMVKDHEASVKLFQRESERGGDAEAKAFAARTLPALRGHLQMAQSINSNLKGGGNKNNNTNRNTSSNMNEM
jgi:putative membrane protein